MSRERELSRLALIIVLAVAVVALVALVAYARGAPHHRGQEVGAWPTTPPSRG